MINKTDLLDRLINEEGLRLKPYIDSVGKMTIGIGRNLTDVGITREEAIYLCMNNIDEVVTDLQEHLDYFDSLPDPAQLVLADMAYNLGTVGLLLFHNTLQFIKSGDYELAAENMLKSKWARQVGQRAIDLSDILKSIT
jgi:lysozyme